jgi:solute carrier family 6 amino acid transporter-like protein 5/7/9/14
VGIGAAIGTACVVSYYCSLMALTIYYFFASFAKTLPWKNCNPDWSEEEICNGTAVLPSVNKTVSELYYG